MARKSMCAASARAIRGAWRWRCLALSGVVIAGCAHAGRDRAGVLESRGAESPPPASSRIVAPALSAAPPDASASGQASVVSPAVDERASFFGVGYPPVLDGAAQRVGSRVWGTWIQPAPDSRSLPLGSIRPGSTLALVDTERVRGRGKCPEFVRVLGGYVCASGRGTLDMTSIFLQAARWTTPAPGLLPYEYALSLGAPMLTRLPRADDPPFETGRRERAKLKGWEAGHDELAEDAPIQPNGPIPDLLANGGSLPTAFGPAQGVLLKRIPSGSMLAYTRAFEQNGEVWVLSSNLSLVPARGLKRFRPSRFRGVELGRGVELPIAWFRRTPRPKWRRGPAGLEPTGERWAVREWVALTGERVEDRGRRFLETRDAGLFVEVKDATLVEPITRRPWEVKGDAKWIHIRVERGSLTLYEGLRPVFTTLVATGKEDATPYGRYFIESKHLVTTMTTEPGEPRRSWIADVPWALYFKRPYALHAAYWHEDFGEKKSGGCVNLSPLDARHVFEWADPPLPAGWESVQTYGMGGGVFVLVEA